MRPRPLVYLALATVAALAAPARAQSGGDIDLGFFRPAMDSRGMLSVNASQVLGRHELSFGLVSAWGTNPLQFASGVNTYQVQHVLTPTLIAAYGLHPGGLELELGATLPFGIMSGDRGPDSDGGTPTNPNDDQSWRFSGQGLGDLSVEAKLRLRNTSGGRTGLAVIGSLGLPTAADRSWIGEHHLVPGGTLVVDREIGRLAVAVNAGVRYRSSERVFRDDAGGVPMTGGRVAVGTTLPFGGAAAWSVAPQRFQLVAEVIGEVPLAGENWFPLEALGGIKVYLARNSFLSLAGGAGLLPGKGGNPDTRAVLGIVFEPNIGDRDGDGLKDDVDVCPDSPEDFDDFDDGDGCPDLDNDHDGILDRDDRCPNEPEDRDGIDDEDGCPEADRFDRDGDGILDGDDGCPDDPEDKDEFEDTDGCPDPDNDGDHILDIDDLCPDDPEDVDRFEDRDGCPDPDNDRDRVPDVDDQCRGTDGQPREETAENWNNYKDDDGCPDRNIATFTDTHLVILKEIHFEFDSAVIKPISYPVLDAVAETINLNPDITRIEVQGHTDERGSDAYNLDLSQRRAESVVAYLTAKQVAAGRLVAQGYGERVPVIKKHTPEAWAANRRVEFLILDRTSDTRD